VTQHGAGSGRSRGASSDPSRCKFSIVSLLQGEGKLTSSQNATRASNPLRNRSPPQLSYVAARTKRKKARPTTQPTPDSGPIPQPYLALAPKPLSSLSRSYLQTPTSSNLVLPSSFRRPATAVAGATSSGDAGPSSSRTRERERERFANGLLAPPAIRAGGSSTPTTTRRDRPVSPGNANAGATGGRRRTDRVRGLGPGNPSVTSLGQLGRIMESDPPATIDERLGNNGSQTPAAGDRRRRRIVRGDDGPGLSRRLTVSSREEGRAMGLARGASMRRLNVWDGTYLRSHVKT
jgi:hypothetical protein